MSFVIGILSFVATVGGIYLSNQDAQRQLATLVAEGRSNVDETVTALGDGLEEIDRSVTALGGALGDDAEAVLTRGSVEATGDSVAAATGVEGNNGDSAEDDSTVEPARNTGGAIIATGDPTVRAVPDAVAARALPFPSKLATSMSLALLGAMGIVYAVLSPVSRRRESRPDV